MPSIPICFTFGDPCWIKSGVLKCKKQYVPVIWSLFLALLPKIIQGFPITPKLCWILWKLTSTFDHAWYLLYYQTILQSFNTVFLYCYPPYGNCSSYTKVLTLVSLDIFPFCAWLLFTHEEITQNWLCFKELPEFSVH